VSRVPKCSLHITFDAWANQIEVEYFFYFLSVSEMSFFLYGRNIYFRHRSREINRPMLQEEEVSEQLYPDICE
jgi:hypothetical protein